jgi:hypothetical protein
LPHTSFLRLLLTESDLSKFVKIGAKIVRHGRYVTFQMAEVAIPRDRFADMLRRIDQLRPKPSST